MTFPGWEGTLPPTHFGKVLRFLWGGGSLPARARRGAALSLGWGMLPPAPGKVLRFLWGGRPFPPAPGEALRFFPGGATPACA